MFKISRDYHFSAAHRLEGHPKCGRLHGHNYHVTIELGTINLPTDSMIMDYGDLDVIVKPIIEAMDHRYLVSKSNIVQMCPYTLIAQQSAPDDIFSMENYQASTAESLSHMIAIEVGDQLRTNGHLAKHTNRTIELKVTVRETIKSVAMFETLVT